MAWGGKRAGAGRPRGRKNRVISTAIGDAAEAPRSVPVQPASDPAVRIESYASLGLDDDEIALLAGISVAKLRATFSRQLSAGPAKSKAKVRAALLTLATSGDERSRVAAIRLWLELCEAAPDDVPQRKGKKAQAAAVAASAGEGTEWGSDLDTPMSTRVN